MKITFPYVANASADGTASALSAAEQAEQPLSEALILSGLNESTSIDVIGALNDQVVRLKAGSVVVEWARADDNSYSMLESLVIGMVDEDEDGELDDDQQVEANELFTVVAEALIQISGMPAATIQKMLENEDDELAEQVAEKVEEKLKPVSSSEVVADFAVKQALLLSSQRKVVRDGKVVIVKTKLRKQKRTAAQKAALKKAQLKSNNSASRAKRKKSNRQRKAHGL